MRFNISNFEHAFYAILMQLFVWFISDDILAGAAFGFAFFLGREHAQAQRSYGLSDFRAFDFRLWSMDSKMDLMFPAISVVILTLVLK